MTRPLPLLSFGAGLAACFAVGPAFADAPRVVADIAPVHALVARVMEGAGEPALVIPPGASPHGHSLRPSEARALQEADLVFWIGEDLTPWMGEAVETLAEGAEVTSLLEVDGVTLLDVREGTLFEGHDHARGEDGHDHGAAGSAHDHGDHEQEEAGGRHDHKHDGEDYAEGEGHAHGARDPHAWLSAANAALWLEAIAADLSRADPDNAGLYVANAAAGREELDALTAEIDAILAPVRGGRFIVFHDAYQYFEEAFGIPAAGAISLSDAAAPGPARIAEIQERVGAEGIDCVLAEPQFNPAMVTTVLDGTDAATAVLDPLGSDLEPGPALYPQLLRNLAQTLAGCL